MLLWRVLAGLAAGAVTAPIAICRFGGPGLILLGAGALMAGSGLAALSAGRRKALSAFAGALGLGALGFGFSSGPLLIRGQLRQRAARESDLRSMGLIQGAPINLTWPEPAIAEAWSAGGWAGAWAAREAESIQGLDSGSQPAPAAPGRQVLLLFNTKPSVGRLDFSKRRDTPELKQAMESLPYHLRLGGTAAIVNPGTGRLAAVAAACGQRLLRVFVPKGALARLLDRVYGRVFEDWSAWEGVAFLQESPAPYLARRPDSYDVVQVGPDRTLPPEEHLTPAALSLYWERLKKHGCLSIVCHELLLPEDRQMAADLCRRLAGLVRQKTGSDGADRLMVLEWGSAKAAVQDVKSSQIKDAPWRTRSKDGQAPPLEPSLPLFPDSWAAPITAYHIILSRDPFSSESLALARAFCAETGGAPLVLPGSEPQGVFQTIFQGPEAHGANRGPAGPSAWKSDSEFRHVMISLVIAVLCIAALWLSPQGRASRGLKPVTVALTAGAAGGLATGWAEAALLGAAAHPENLDFFLLGGAAGGAALVLGWLGRSGRRFQGSAPFRDIVLAFWLALLVALSAGAIIWLGGAILRQSALVQTGAILGAAAVAGAGWAGFACEFLSQCFRRRLISARGLASVALLSALSSWVVSSSAPLIPATAARAATVAAVSGLAWAASALALRRSAGNGGR